MRKLLIFSVLVFTTALFAQERVRVVSRQLPKGEYAFYAANPYLYPVQLDIRFPRYINLKSDVKIPFHTVLPPQSSRKKLFTLKPAGTGRYGYSMSYLVSPGDPGMQPDPDVIYSLPFAHGTKHKVGQGYFGTFSHSRRTGEYAIDFDMKVGTPVLASRAGLVVDTKDDSNIRGLTSSYAKYGNYILIYHKDGTFARYLHLRYNGSIVRAGDRVRRGQKIGYSGNTGWTSGPHLHFQVSRVIKGGLQTIPTDFLLFKGQKGRLTPGRYYYGWQAGKKIFSRIFGRNLKNSGFNRHLRATGYTGEVKIRTKQIDDAVILYGVNGMKKTVTIKVEPMNMRNAVCTKKLPYTREMPPLKEVFLLIIRSRDPAKQWSYGYRYSCSW